MFTKSTLLFFTLCWLAGDQSQHISYEVSCQYYYNKPLKKNVYTTGEIEPEFPGGAAGYLRFLNKNLRISEDTVDEITSLPIPRMKFIVDTDGQIINPSIQGKNDTTNLNSLERAALQFIKKNAQMGTWHVLWKSNSNRNRPPFGNLYKVGNRVNAYLFLITV